MQKIQARTLHQQVADRMREMIRSGTLVRGQKIDEKVLSQAMGVSRTPVRESLRMLASEGLIELVPHKGAYVSQPCIEEIRDMFAVMSVLEGMSARLAAEKMDPEQFHRIERLHRKLERHYLEQDHTSYLKDNQVLHQAVQEISGNPTLMEVINGLRQKILLYRQEQLYQPERFRQSVEEHRGILEALRRRDAEAAESAMRGHLMRQCSALVGLYASRRGKGGEKMAA